MSGARKAKARRCDGAVIMHVTTSGSGCGEGGDGPVYIMQPGLYIPDGAPLPMAREVGRVVTAARSLCKNRDLAAKLEMIAAVAALDRARKGRK